MLAWKMSAMLIRDLEIQIRAVEITFVARSITTLTI